ncbi:DoxX family protein [Burkholderia ubonensis]|uniref:LysR family transcriptional regulator n=1 Tax=Burkholderia ubonensis subsp. mesacidophila TaxID=265293 RepID=A0A2A4F4D3_9BURK|nr:DoxX family protein [Burkholderia ubonensis]PCE27219.1 LysR family transcriptional regulator [Burkholderia ubonensis subsp. mesacidophila]
MNNPTHIEAATIPSVTSNAVNTIVPAIGRVLISAIFILSGLSKLAAPAMTIGYIQSAGLPLPYVAFGLAALVETVGGTALLLGYRTRVVASVLFVFSLATAVFFHHDFGDQNQFIHFFKNVAMAGGLLHVVAFGGGRISLDGRRA